MMPDEEAHWISVVVADDDPYSPDARMTRVVRAGKWEGMVPDTTTSDSNSDADTDPGTTTDSSTGDTSASDSQSPTSGLDPDTGAVPTGGSDASPTSGVDATSGSGTTAQDTTPADGDTSGCACRSAAAPSALWLLALLVVPRRRRAG
jgi:MYXO-CTERM domain-containing protein